MNVLVATKALPVFDVLQGIEGIECKEALFTGRVYEASSDVQLVVVDFEDLVPHPYTMDMLQSLLTEQGPELEQAVTNFRQLGEDLNRLVAANRSRLSSMMEDGEQAAATVRDTVEDLRRSPWRLLKPLDVDDYTQSLYDTARELVLSSRELASTAEELKRLRGSAPTDAQRARLEQLLESAAKRLARAAELQEELWETLKARR